MSEKVTRWIIYCLGIFCFIMFLAVRIQPLFNALLLEKYIPGYWENTKWGELYYLNSIRYFREKGLPEYHIKYRFSDRHPSLAEADILAFGDSYFDFSRMTTFPEQLADSTHERVFYAREKYPLSYLSQQHYVNSKKKYFIYETAERFLPGRFEKPQMIPRTNQDTSEFYKIVHKSRLIIFPTNSEINYSMLLSRSYFTTHIYSAIATLKFDLFGQINSQTPTYLLTKERPWLFGGGWFGDGPARYSYDDTPAEIENYCNNIQKLAFDLKENYNLEMIFMIIPSKYTIYHYLLNVPDADYGRFIPKMYSELEKRGIPVIKVYDQFMAQRDEKLLYYGTDTHWTENGLHIALNETLDVLDSLKDRDYNANPDNHKKGNVQNN
jgi:hypothetical protein